MHCALAGPGTAGCFRMNSVFCCSDIYAPTLIET